MDASSGALVPGGIGGSTGPRAARAPSSAARATSTSSARRRRDERQLGRVSELRPGRLVAGDDRRRAVPPRVEGRVELTLQIGKDAIRLLGTRDHERIGCQPDFGPDHPGPEDGDEGHERHREGGRAPGPYHGSMDPATLRALPKAELHQHLDGSVRPATAVELAADIGLALSLDEARRRMVGPPRCEDQAELLGFFDLPIAVLQTTDGAAARGPRAGRGPRCGRDHVRGGALGPPTPPRARAVGGRRHRGRGRGRVRRDGGPGAGASAASR